MKDTICPYCGAEVLLNHEDGYGYEEDIIYQQECSECGKNFVYTTTIRFTYHPAKADCLNGAEHNFQRTTTYPEFCAKMQCLNCGEEKSLPKEEFERLFKKYNEENKKNVTLNPEEI